MSPGVALASLAGDLLIDLGSLLLLIYGGRVAGISGIVGGLIPPCEDAGWRLTFLALRRGDARRHGPVRDAAPSGARQRP